MKIGCYCGHVIRDQSDYINYKAYLVADLDYNDLAESIDAEFENLADKLEQGQDDKMRVVEQAISNAHYAILKYTRRALFQCTQCGRLYLDDSGFQLQSFTPQDDDAPKNLLRSTEGDGWKMFLNGRWTEATRGELWWGSAGAEEGYELHTDIEKLRERYFTVLDRLERKHILRRATLRVNGETVHERPRREMTSTP